MRARAIRDRGPEDVGGGERDGPVKGTIFVRAIFVRAIFVRTIIVRAIFVRARGCTAAVARSEVVRWVTGWEDLDEGES